MNTGSGGMTKDIGMTADGFADSAAQDTFCSGSVVHRLADLYDQSGNDNDLKRGTDGHDDRRNELGDGRLRIECDQEVADGRRSQGLRALYECTRGIPDALNVKATGVPMGNTAQGIYKLADGTHVGTQCCWDFGSVSPDPDSTSP